RVARDGLELRAVEFRADQAGVDERGSHDCRPGEVGPGQVLPGEVGHRQCLVGAVGQAGLRRRVGGGKQEKRGGGEEFFHGFLKITKFPSRISMWPSSSTTRYAPGWP